MTTVNYPEAKNEYEKEKKKETETVLISSVK